MSEPQANEPSVKKRVYHLAEILPSSRIVGLPDVCTKKLALQALLDSLAASGAVKTRVAAEEAILSREVLMSTGVGYGIAVPHARLASVDEFALAMGIHPTGIKYSSIIDDQPVRLVCMIIGPSGRQSDYLRILAMVMKFLKHEKGKVLSAYTLGEVHRYTTTYDTSEGGPGDS